MLKFLLALSVLVCANRSYANDYHASSPQEAEKMVNKASAGDRIFLKAGTYKDAVIRLFNSAGTENSPILFLAENPGKVIFEGNSSLSISGSYLIVNGFVWKNGGAGLGSRSVVEFRNGKNIAENCSLEDCLIDSFNTDPKENTENKWVSLYGQYNTVTRCLFRNKENRGPTLTVWLESGKPSFHTISYNYFQIRGNIHNDSNGLESIRVGDSRTSFTEAHCVVAFNRFEDCDGEIEIISNKSCRNSYLHNTFYRNDGGLTLRHGNNCLVSGNFFYGGTKMLAYGVRIIGEGHVVVDNLFYDLRGGEKKGFRSALSILNGVENSPLHGYFQVKDASVEGNVFINCPPPSIYSGFHTRPEAKLPPENISIKNNLIYCDSGRRGPAYIDELRPLNLRSEDNYVIGLLQPEGVKGFNSIRNKGIKRKGFDLTGLPQEVADKVFQSVAYPENSGASFIPPALKAAISERKYSFLLPADVGPVWFR